jgi:hypothetical protein
MSYDEELVGRLRSTFKYEVKVRTSDYIVTYFTDKVVHQGEFTTFEPLYEVWPRAHKQVKGETISFPSSRIFEIIFRKHNPGSKPKSPRKVASMEPSNDIIAPQLAPTQLGSSIPIVSVE